MKLAFADPKVTVSLFERLAQLQADISFSWCDRVLCFAFLMILSIGTYASKDRGVYVGAGVNLINVGVVDPFNNEVNFKAGELLIGYKYNNYLGLEVRGGASFQDESIRVEDPDTGLRGSVSSNIDHYGSVYYRAEMSNEIAKIYVLLGQSTVATTVEFDDTDTAPVELSESGLSYGFGFGLWLDERMNLNFEYRSIVSTDNDSFTSGGISADYRF